MHTSWTPLDAVNKGCTHVMDSGSESMAEIASYPDGSGSATRVASSV